MQAYFDKVNILDPSHGGQRLQYAMVLFDLRFQEAEKLAISNDVFEQRLSSLSAMLCAVHAKQKKHVSRPQAFLVSPRWQMLSLPDLYVVVASRHHGLRDQTG